MKRCRYCGGPITVPKRRRFCSEEHARASARHDARDRRERNRALGIKR